MLATAAPGLGVLCWNETLPELRAEGAKVTASILFIDDDTKILKELQPAFLGEGYHVRHASPGLEAIRTMLLDEPDLVILSIDSRDEDWQFCYRLLTFLDRPLLLLLDSRNELDRVKGLELGADDCMTQPILNEEVIARAGSLLRRTDYRSPRSKRGYFVDGDLVVDLTRREAWLKGEPVALTPTEFRLLYCFAMHLGEVVPYEQIVAHVWGPGYPGGRNSVKLYVHQLRQKLEAEPSRPRRIVTRRGRGYMFRALGEAKG